MTARSLFEQTIIAAVARNNYRGINVVIPDIDTNPIVFTVRTPHFHSQIIEKISVDMTNRFVIGRSQALPYLRLMLFVACK
jgi:hypothetical protein